MIDPIYIQEICNLSRSFKQNKSTEDNAKKYVVRWFEVLTAVSTKMAVFWVVAPCSLL
jgi:hypothetical protein